jgi:peptidoglycan/xylan/chitin deacetylase (PgdA/CDA1 family)
MSIAHAWLRFENRYRETLSGLRHRRPQAMRNTKPLISFTFDDVPRSSCTRGRQILEGFGLRASYYLSMSLMDSVYSIGAAFSRTDLEQLIAGGHEIGSHTFGHLDAWNTKAAVFEASIHENQRKLDEIHPGLGFKTFSYPIRTPHPRIKKKAGKLHLCCRGGGQTYNTRTVDLNLLKSYFVDARNRDDPDVIKKIIQESCERGGWLIFSTHDIDEHPSPYGCTPRALEDLVSYAHRSGSDILPVCEACGRLAPLP